MTIRKALANNWPEYLIEGALLGLFMISAGFFGCLLWAPASPLAALVTDELVRRALMGLAMGSTAIVLIYSNWGKRSGAHMNPATTLTFWRLGKVKTVDALFYIGAQVLGGTAGVLLVRAALGQHFTAAPVGGVVTVPGALGVWPAFVAEVLMTLILMTAILGLISSERWATHAGVVAGSLVALYITFEAPISGMSLNPARTLSSALPAQNFDGLWIYMIAPVIGMWLAVDLDRILRRRAEVHCAKLHHDNAERCIHCGSGVESSSSHS